MTLAKQLNAARRDVGQLEKRLDDFTKGSPQHKQIGDDLKGAKKILSDLEAKKEAARKLVTKEK